MGKNQMARRQQSFQSACRRQWAPRNAACMVSVGDSSHTYVHVIGERSATLNKYQLFGPRKLWHTMKPHRSQPNILIYNTCSQSSSVSQSQIVIMAVGMLPKCCGSFVRKAITPITWNPRGTVRRSNRYSAFQTWRVSRCMKEPTAKI